MSAQRVCSLPMWKYNLQLFPLLSLIVVVTIALGSCHGSIAGGVHTIDEGQHLTQPDRSVSQQLVLLDASGSMGSLVQSRSRIAWAREGIDAYVSGFPLETKIGLQTFGGSCEGAQIFVPVRERNQENIFSVLERVAPNGLTPLAAALEQSAQAFDWNLEGKKVVVVLTDGGESCGGDVCEAVKKLRQQSSDVQVNVVGILLDDFARQQLSCLTDLTGGSFLNLTPQDLPSLGNVLVSLSESMLKRLVALCLGLGALAAWCHGIHLFLVSALLGRKGVAATVASFAGIAVAAFFVALLFQPVQPILSRFPLPLGITSLGITIVALLFLRTRHSTRGIHISLSLTIAFLLVGSPSYGGELQVQRQGQILQVGRDHIIALDQSGSMEKFWQQIQAQVKAYVTAQVREGDTFTLLAFTDHTDFVGSWHVAGNEDREDIRKRVEALRPITESYTVFTQLLTAIAQHLKNIALPDHEQVVLIFSDGKQSLPPGFQGQDIPFKTVGEKTFKVGGYFIAVVGNNDLNPVMLKGKPFSSSSIARGAGVVREWRALLCPLLSLEGEGTGELRLVPSWFGWWTHKVPFSVNVASTSTLPKEIDVDTLITFDSGHVATSSGHLSLHEGKGEIFGALSAIDVPTDARQATIVVNLPHSFSEHVLRAPVVVHRVSWVERFTWFAWIVGIVVSAGCIAGAVRLIPKRFGALWITSGHGEPIPLPCGGATMIGGPGGLGPEDLPTVGRLVRGRGSRVFLEPTGLPDTALKFNGSTVTGKCPYAFGSPFVCVSGRREEQVTITRAARPRPQRHGAALQSTQNLFADDLL